MKQLPDPAYYFRTPAQLKAVHETGLAEELIIDPDSGVDAGAVGDCPVLCLGAALPDSLFWVNKGGFLFADGAKGPRVGQASRIVVGTDSLWILAEERLVQLDRSTLQVLVDRPATGVLDVAADGRGGLWLLCAGMLARMDARGSDPVRAHSLDGQPRAIAAVGRRLAILDWGCRRLDLFDAGSPEPISLDLTEDRLGGEKWLGEEVELSAAGDNFLLTGMIKEAAKERGFLLIGADGGLLTRARWRQRLAPDLLAGCGSDLVGLFGEDGGRRLRRFAGLARGGGRRRLTPALETASPAGTWLRAEVEARLPEGATLALRWFATHDEGIRQWVEAELARPRPMAERLDKVEERLVSLGSKPRQFTYAGEPHDGEPPLECFAFPLHEARGPILWIELQLRRNAAAAEGEITGLVVRHETRSLVDDLPAIYRGDGDGDGTLRRLVGVLEATSHDIDRRIGALAERLDPKRTEAHWLGDLAAMLGLPFHESLTEEMKRGLVAAAGRILARRGTRAGLLEVLESLFGRRPFRVIDRTEQLVPLALGGRGATGRPLPGLLSGPSVRAPKLNARLVLNRTALCQPNACADAAIAPPPQVLVIVSATYRERRRYGAAVRSLIEAMIPAGVRLQLSWSAWRGGSAQATDDVLAVVDAPEMLSVGVGPALGHGRTGGRAVPRLDRHGVSPAEHKLL